MSDLTPADPAYWRATALPRSFYVKLPLVEPRDLDPRLKVMDDLDEVRTKAVGLSRSTGEVSRSEVRRFGRGDPRGDVYASWARLPRVRLMRC